jgi:hypothetical protein
LFKKLHSEKAMVYGVIGFNFNFKPIFLSKNVNYGVYIGDVLIRIDLVWEIDEYYDVGNWIFRFNNVRPHASKVIKAVLKEF